MKSTRRPGEADLPYPQPLASEGQKLPEGGCEEREAFEAWLAHVEAGRIGGE